MKNNLCWEQKYCSLSFCKIRKKHWQTYALAHSDKIAIRSAFTSLLHSRFKIMQKNTENMVSNHFGLSCNSIFLQFAWTCWIWWLYVSATGAQICILFTFFATFTKLCTSWLQFCWQKSRSPCAIHLHSSADRRLKGGDVPTTVGLQLNNLILTRQYTKSPLA